MTNQDVVDIVAAGLSEDVIVVASRQAGGRNLDLGPGGLITLKRGKVPDAIILAMQASGGEVSTRCPSPESFGEGWTTGRSTDRCQVADQPSPRRTVMRASLSRTSKENEDKDRDED